jgi:hypothetical protein
VVIVFSFGQRLLARTSTLSGTTMATLYGLPRLKTYTTSRGITRIQHVVLGLGALHG